MMGDRLRLALGFDQRLSSAPMQRLAAALEQAVVGRILDQCMLEAIIGLRRCTLDKQEVSIGKPIQ